ncbi:MAG: RNA polymerase sporulation sigma factor SigK [Oscillospiraceae bacterium]|nr:RNA polymerase sporulation sigma factor SigK [Oscillospiraceae bacterium]
MLSAFLMLVNSVLWMLRLGSSGSFPRPLKPAEEQEYLERWINGGDIDARNKLIEHNLRLVAHIMKKYYTQNADQDDLISIGTIGLIKGVSTYRPDKGVRLATYASRCIENEILMFFRAARKSSSDLSLSDAIETDGDGNNLSLMDILCTDDDMLDDLSARESYTQLRSCVQTALTPREAEIITLRYGLLGAQPLPQREVAQKFGISRSYVSRRA